MHLSLLLLHLLLLPMTILRRSKTWWLLPEVVMEESQNISKEEAKKLAKEAKDCKVEEESQKLNGNKEYQNLVFKKSQGSQ